MPQAAEESHTRVRGLPRGKGGGGAKPDIFSSARRWQRVHTGPIRGKESNQDHYIVADAVSLGAAPTITLIKKGPHRASPPPPDIYLM